MRYVGLLAGIGLIVAFGALGPPAWATSVDLELALLVDVSGSVDDTEFLLQRTGYVDAFNHADIYNAVDNGPYGSIAVTLIYWSGATQQQTAVDWTQISDETSSKAFATAIGSTTQPYEGMTGLGEALKFGADQFANGFEGTRLVIDISGDGVDNDPYPETYPSSVGKAYALGIVNTINGLVIGTSTTVYTHYQDDVVGGTNYFLTQVDSFDDFGAAVKEKLVKEITVIPEPVTMAGLMLGIGCLARYVRRRKV